MTDFDNEEEISKHIIKMLKIPPRFLFDMSLGGMGVGLALILAQLAIYVSTDKIETRSLDMALGFSIFSMSIWFALAWAIYDRILDKKVRDPKHPSMSVVVGVYMPIFGFTGTLVAIMATVMMVRPEMATAMTLILGFGLLLGMLTRY